MLVYLRKKVLRAMRCPSQVKITGNPRDKPESRISGITDIQSSSGGYKQREQ